MQTYVYTRKHVQADAPDSDSDTDSDTGSDPGTDSEGRSASAPPVFPDGLKSEAFAAAWANYVDYRRKNRMRALKPDSVAAKLAEMAGWGESAAIEAIRTTMRNGWTGVFEPKGGAPSGARPGATNAKSTYDQEAKAHGYTL